MQVDRLSVSRNRYSEKFCTTITNLLTFTRERNVAKRLGFLLYAILRRRRFFHGGLLVIRKSELEGR